MRPALLALTICAFAIGTTEFVIVGLIPGLARDLQVSVPAAGLLVSLYALSITIGAPLMTALTGRLPRRTLAIALMVIFTLGNLIAALSPGYEMLLAGRIITGVAHGVFFSIGATIATSLVEPSRASRAVALMFAGLTVAMVVGVPFGALVGQMWGWRAPLFAVAGMGALSVAALAALLPSTIPHTPPSSLAGQMKQLARPGLISLYSISVFGFGASFIVFTYFAPLLTQVTGVSERSVGLALLLFGLATVVGNLMGGRLADSFGDRKAVMMVLLVLIATLAVMPWSVREPIWMFLTIAVWGAAAFAISPILQSSVVALASREAPSAVGTASGLNIAAFNLGISGASFIGSLIVLQPGVQATPWAALVAALIALGLAWISPALRPQSAPMRQG